jgi:ribosomal protein L27
MALNNTASGGKNGVDAMTKFYSTTAATSSQALKAGQISGQQICTYKYPGVHLGRLWLQILR